MFTLHFSTSNDAFDDCPEECVRILREIANALRHGQADGAVRDINGNTIGKWELAP